ncbi:MAG TPA: hypothetical protein VKP14_01030 [Gaiellaceae bacterium]|nr:hypothetical protein [Gaiellaceae bacterium]
MLKRVFIAALVVLALMVVIKDGRLLRTTGLIASCSVVTTAADGTQLEECRPGKIEGAHNLSSQGCTDAGAAGREEYWRCPAPVVASQVGR